MERYQNLEGNSGVIAYETGEGSIAVQFKDATYLYTNASTGAGKIKRMQALAKSGKGLSTFISKYVRENYEKKLR
jgi:hypothetical protein